MEERTDRAQGGDTTRHEHPGDEILNAYLDPASGGLGAEGRARTDAHLAACADCREALRELMAVRAMLHDLPQEEPRRSFILTPELATAAGSPRRGWQAPRWLWPTRWATAVAAVIFALTIGLGARPQANVVAVSTATPATMTLATAPPAIATTSALCSNDPLTQDCLRIAGLTPTIFPTPTAIPALSPITPAPTTATDWRPAQIFSGLLTLLGAFYGFVLPAFQRRGWPLAS